MHEEYERPERNIYKVKAFKSAISTLKQLDHPLRSIKEAKEVSTQIFFDFLGSQMHLI